MEEVAFAENVNGPSTVTEIPLFQIQRVQQMDGDHGNDGIHRNINDTVDTTTAINISLITDRTIYYLFHCS